jgi:hypothetical protein
MQNGKIFISYRRGDSSGESGRLNENLEQIFGDENVYFDIEAIEGGINFRKDIIRALNSCKVLIAVIGPSWLDIADEYGKRRLENPDDFILLEISTALERGIMVIPLLINGATQPKRDELPNDIKDLAELNSVEISNKRWKYDFNELVKILKRKLRKEVIWIDYKKWFAKHYLWVSIFFLMLFGASILATFYPSFYYELFSDQPTHANQLSPIIKNSNLSNSINGAWNVYRNEELMGGFIFTIEGNQITFIQMRLAKVICSGDGKMEGDNVSLFYFNSGSKPLSNIELTTSDSGMSWSGNIKLSSNEMDGPVELRRY